MKDLTLGEEIMHFSVILLLNTVRKKKSLPILLLKGGVDNAVGSTSFWYMLSATPVATCLPSYLFGFSYHSCSLDFLVLCCMRKGHWSLVKSSLKLIRALHFCQLVRY